jgi:hypothetical protein
MRAVDLYVAISAISILGVQIMLWTRRLFGADAVRRAMTRQAQLCYPARY